MKVEHYKFGELSLEGKIYRHDLKIVAGRVVANWWRRQGHLLQADDIADVLEIRPRLLVVGCGAYGVMRIDAGLPSRLEREGIELFARPTGEAVGKFNSWEGRAGDICAAFHLTC